MCLKRGRSKLFEILKLTTLREGMSAMLRAVSLKEREDVVGFFAAEFSHLSMEVGSTLKLR